MKKNRWDNGAWTPLRIVFFYAFFGVLWILFSDNILLALTYDPELLSRLQTCKGWFFILVTATLLFGLMVSMMRRRERVLHDLRESEEYNRLLFELSPLGLALCRMDGGLVDLNPAYARILGRSVEQTLALSYWDITPSKYTEQEQAQLESLKTTGSYGPYEKECLHQDGHLVPVRLHGVIIDKGGKKFIWSSVEDISERKKAEKAWQRNEQVLRLFVEHAPAAIAMFDHEMRYMVASRRFLLDYNLGDQNIIGRSHYEVFPEIPERWREIHRRCLSGAVEKSEEDSFQRADGTIDWIRWETHPWYEIQGEIGGIILFSEVITEHKRAEEELSFHRDHLEELVAERTAALDETRRALLNLVEDLEQANIKLQELDRLKSMFIASMSHELRTPLNSIIGFSGILLQGLSGEINEEQRDQLGRVFSAGKYLLSLITDVIDIAKIESGKITPYSEDFDLHALIDEAVGQVRQQAAVKGLAIEESLPVHSTVMHSDRKRLLQCLLNYLSNAVKFTEKGVISISARAVGGQVEFAVQDTGIGIKPEDIPLLFCSFVRLENHLTTAMPGTGLGLYLTKKLAADVLAGKVGLESTQGKGSRFWISVPVVLEEKAST